MSHQIAFKCRDKSVEIDHEEPILESAIRAGLAVNYGCNSGNCGLCVASLISGEIKEIAHYDYHMSDADKQAGKFLMCTHTAAADLVVETELGEVRGYIAPQTFPVKVRSVKTPSEHVRVLSVQPSRSFRLRFFAGQHGRIASKTDVGEYAIGSCPCDATRIEFHVSDLTDDGFCRYVFNDCAAGDVLEMEAPFGNFVFSEDMHRPIIFLAVGMGFAPIKSLLEHITAQESDLSIYLYWAASEGGHYLDNLCRSWDNALDQLEYQRLTMDIDDVQEAVTCVGKILKRHADVDDTDLYCCAPAALLPEMYQAAQQCPPTWRFFCEKIHTAPKRRTLASAR